MSRFGHISLFVLLAAGGFASRQLRSEKPKLIYKSDVENRIDGDKWSQGPAFYSTNGERRYLGPLIHETFENGYTITSSHPKPDAWDCVGEPADGFVPPLSTAETPHFTWYPALGKPEWLQYEFPNPREISAAEVFWFVAHTHGAKGCKLPKSWKVTYQNEAGYWVPVKTGDAYELKLDEFNRITFEKVKTTAVRLEVELSDTHSAGVHEFRIGQK